MGVSTDKLIIEVRYQLDDHHLLDIWCQVYCTSNNSPYSRNIIHSLFSAPPLKPKPEGQQVPTNTETTDSLLRVEAVNQQLSKENQILHNRVEEQKQELQQLRSELEQQNRAFTVKCEERQRAETQLRMSQLIVDRSPVVLFRRGAGEQHRLEFISDNFKQFGYLPEDMLSGKHTFKEIVHPEDQDLIRDQIREFAEADAEEYTQIYRLITGDGEVRWVEDQTSVVRDENGKKTHNQGILIDITERKIAEDSLRKSEEKFRRIVETTAEGFLLMDENLRIQEVNDAYISIVGYPREELLGKTPTDLATESFKQFMLANKDSLLSQPYREFEITVVHKDGHHVPILIHGNILTDDLGKVIGNMAFITDMTEQKKALILAGEVQKSLLPQDKPTVPGLDVAGRNVSCDEIGGDYYDFLWRREAGKGPLSVVVGDISGHGVESALLMTTARAFLRMRASQPGSISDIITAMNSHLAKDVLETGRFMTLFYLAIDSTQKNLTWVRAGHDPALLYDPAKDNFEELKGSGVALGVIDEVEYRENQRSGLTNGQIIAVGTDGIWEASNQAGEMFGKERLRSIIRRLKDENANIILNGVYRELEQFTLGQKSEDDITLVIIKVDGL